MAVPLAVLMVAAGSRAGRAWDTGAAGSLVLRRMDRREGPKLKYFIFFVVAMYLLATAAFGVKHYFDHPEQGPL